MPLWGYTVLLALIAVVVGALFFVAELEWMLWR